MLKQSFKKSERLTSRDDIEALFASETSFFVYPFKVYLLSSDKNNNETLKLLIAAPKRNFKHAVDRNHIKRLTKEAYRLNKVVLTNPKISALGLVYTEKKIVPYSQIEKSIVKVLKKAFQKP